MRSRLDAIDGPPVGRRTETDSEEVEINVDELYAEDAKTGVILLDCELRDSCEGEADEVTGMGVAVTVGKVAELVVRSWDVELVRVNLDIRAHIPQVKVVLRLPVTVRILVRRSLV